MADSADGAVAPSIREERCGACHVFTIDRGGALNALDAGMIATLAASYPKLARDSNLYAVLIKSADPKAFSAGGDVRALIALARRDPAAARAWLKAEYAFNWLTECFSKPSVALIDGLVMGSGVGISAYATHRVGGPKYKFAMPETAIGLFPDVGMAHALARMPNQIGLYLGLTGLPIGRADAFALGLLTHCIEAEHYSTIEAGLADAQTVDPLLDKLHRDPGPGGELSTRAVSIADWFASTSVAGILAALGADADAGDEFARATRDTLRTRSPLALAVTLRHIRDAAGLDLRQTLQVDYRLASRFLGSHDFPEGVRAALIDKDHTPQWRPASIADVTDDMLDDLFAPLPAGDELILPLRQEMQAMRV
ncbi:MAG: enoyl-CoA hydratase/isomerase family protein [Hyphomicrobium aestuarii]|nr:enoyl-CoA hydratase/isomerase family protein [Hyphomicrobium aestuarii]